MDIKENIRFILEKRGMTQKNLADKLGVSKTAVGYYLRGNITINNLQKIADALDTTVETIVSETPLYAKGGPIQDKGRVTSTSLVCPHCGEPISIVAR